MTLRRRSSVPLALLVLACAIGPYLPALSNGFVQDDHVVVETGAVVARGELREIFATDYWGALKGNDQSLYRPVTILSWALERRISATPNPQLAHAVNVALHAAVALLLFGLARRTASAPEAAAAAALFAVHPVHTEAVASIVGRADVLACLFTLAALHIHASRGAGAARDWIRSLATAVCVFLAAGSKEAGIAAPFLLVAYDLLFRRQGYASGTAWIIDRATAWAPSAAAAGAYLFLRTLALGALTKVQELPSTDNRLVLLAGQERFATAVGLAARYVRLFLFPFGLSADRSGGVIPPEAGCFTPRALAGFAILLGALALALLPAMRAARRQNHSGPFLSNDISRAAFAALGFLLPYLVVGNLLVLIRATVAERLLYLPSVGLCLLAGLAAGRLGTRANYVYAAYALVLVLFAALTFRQSRLWRNEETLFSAALRSSPASPRAAFILGKVRAEQGRHAEALALFERAHNAWPDFVGAWVDAATELTRAGKPADAEARLREAIARQPDYGGAHHNLGVLLRAGGRRADAERSLRKATLYDPALHRAWAELGHLYFDAGRWRAAAAAYEHAVGLGRNDLLPRLREARERARSIQS